MGVKSFIKKSVAFVSALAMACSMVVMPAGVSHAVETDRGLSLNKNIELQSDGTYKIRLEAYAKGTVTKLPDKINPCDIVLVLDQSGSMAYGLGNAIKCGSTTSEQKALGATEGYYCYYSSGWNSDNYYKVRYYNNKWQYFSNNSNWNGSGRWINLYNSSSIYVSRIGALKQSVTNFVDSIKDNAVSKNVDHRIAIVGYASNSNAGKSSNGFISPGSSGSSYVDTGVFLNGTLNNYSTSLSYDNALVNVKNGNAVANSITTAIGNIACSGGTYTEYGLQMANNILSLKQNKDNGHDKVVVVFTDGETDSGISSVMTQANTLKGTNNARVYTVGMFESTTSSIENFLSYMSSNYANDVSYSNRRYSGTYNDTNKYSMTAGNKEELNNIFTTIAGDIQGSADVELDASAVTRDIITDNLDVPSNLSSKVSAYTESYLGNNEWKEATETPENTPQVSISGKTVDVTNFNFKDNFVAEANESAGTPARGKRLVIEISGLTAVKSGEKMITNVTEQSGVYENNQATTPIDTFNECSITIPDKSYVLDYGKTVSTNAVTDHNLKAVTKLNTAKPAPSDIPDATTMQGTYGTFDISSLKTDGGLKYTPGKINWDGFDTAYVFGQVNGSTKYLWGAVNFIPASSVYYEDDFGYETNDKSDVAIVWGTDENGKSLWNKEGTSTGGQQSSENKLYGNDSLYAEEKGYTNGSAHVSDKEGATAKFTFTGTGVDIYSRTNKDFAGVIFARLVSDTDTSFKAQNILVDNTSESGDYYQVPTLAFEDLPYGKYTVTLTVVANDKDGRSTYYLDGIRVYNPLGKVSNDSVAGKAYKEAGESNAVYKKVRDNLVTSGFGSITYEENGETVEQQGAVYIDKITDSTSHETYDETVFDKYGPKNEVYLDNGQAVAFNISGYTSNNNVFIGLKSLTGEEITVNVTNGDDSLTPITIKSTADLYYPIKPTSSGNVVIINKGNAKLSITKVRVTEKEPTTVSNASYSLMSTRALASYVDTVYTLPVVEDKTDDDTILDKDDVEIENPSDDNQNNQEEKPTSIWEQILNSIKDWFGNR